jgi:hypothetical protein
MPTKAKSPSRDRSRVSSEKHEIAYTASKLKKTGRGKAVAAVRSAKKALGRKVSRSAVVARAKRA